MAAKKTETAVDVIFEGGPVDGLRMRVVIPPPQRVRMVTGVNDWGTYTYTGTKSYEYIGTEWSEDG